MRKEKKLGVWTSEPQRTGTFLLAQKPKKRSVRGVVLSGGGTRNPGKSGGSGGANWLREHYILKKKLFSERPGHLRKKGSSGEKGTIPCFASKKKFQSVTPRPSPGLFIIKPQTKKGGKEGEGKRVRLDHFVIGEGQWD